MTLLLYGIVRADHPLPPGLRAVVAGDLAVVVSDIGSSAELAAEDARAHLNVLCGLVVDGPILPLRFGSMAPDDQAVRDSALLPNAAAVRLELDRLTGMVEVRVQLAFDETAALEALADTDPDLAQPITGFDAAIARGRRIADHVKEWSRQRSGELLGGLSTAMVRLDEPDDGTQHWALLVRHDEIHRVAESIAAMPSTVTATALGPLPPYAFASLPTRTPSRWGFD
ncbi:GvpL/GvpF family gas vesicle protein [Kutzneria buriramensis]|uniref:Gas vesicle protein GvpL/GvpF n=1 Tax=Kutzneria buriramensis TaxID=1045776 RepID=A0A3E0HHM8_9PSEU|nr:GvpL/GvpF family gas vesicle protein [Kutzneria buriramensis]REH45999.1 gas vesicle protein GvpL/GvpF [Kutzneria buriramensis]